MARFLPVELTYAALLLKWIKICQNVSPAVPPVVLRPWDMKIPDYQPKTETCHISKSQIKSLEFVRNSAFYESISNHVTRRCS